MIDLVKKAYELKKDLPMSSKEGLELSIERLFSEIKKFFKQIVIPNPIKFTGGTHYQLRDELTFNINLAADLLERVNK